MKAIFWYKISCVDLAPNLAKGNRIEYPRGFSEYTQN